jgi:integrase
MTKCLSKKDEIRLDPPLLMTHVQQVPGVAARALEWLIVTRCRPDEAVGAAWPEIDAAAKLWRIPAEREKHNRGHVVHLSDEALAILDKVRPLRRDDLLFPKTSKPALAKCLKRLSPRATLHGFFAKR